MEDKDQKPKVAADHLAAEPRQPDDARAGIASNIPPRPPRDMASTSRRAASRSISPRLTRSATTPVISTSQNLAASPLPSREVSPIRPSPAIPKYSTTRVSRSRKNSTEQSPQRTPSHTPTATQSVPSAAAVQRALAAVGDKKLPSPTTSQFSSDALEPRKTARGSASSPATPARLTSPPSISRLKGNATRTPEQQPSIPGTLNLAKPTSAIETIQEEDDTGNATSEGRYSARSGLGSKLATVQEDSPSSTPALSDSMLAAQRPSTIQEDPDEDNPDMTSSQTTSGTRSSTTTAEHGSGSDDAAGRKNKGKEQTRTSDLERSAESQKTAPAIASASRKPSINQLVPKPTAVQPRRSFQHLNPARNKEGSVKSMTVETETVSNPDLIGDRDGRSTSGRLDGGSIRTKASTETIRPKRERKRPRKAANIVNGTASSKADIFEAKVASAVDEAANSSDSEETFVYESNPPEPRSSHRNQHGNRYHHTRTPSAASVASQSTDNYRNNHFGISGKKSMKFVNANQLRDPDDEDSGYYPSNTARSSHRHHHHLARLNRFPQNQSHDSESPANSMRSPRTRQFNSWRTHGNRPTPDSESIVSTMADKPQNASMYDLSHGAEADDEFTPLLNNRNGRNDPRLRRNRLSKNDSYERTPMRNCVSCAKYTCISIFMGAVVALVIMALVLCNRRLFDVNVTQVRNVLASEQELFLEFAVTARNPNLVDVSIAEGDLDIFAKSKYVGTTQMWRDGTIPGIEPPGNNTKPLQFIPDDNVDDGTDPIEDPGSGTHTMLLGKVTDLESPLVFESSPFNHALRHSVAGLRLSKPGNKTEEGGSRRWENVLQHPFELVIVGRLRYYLPLSSKGKPTPITIRTIVVPDKPIDEDDPKRNDTVRIRGKQKSVQIKLSKSWSA